MRILDGRLHAQYLTRSTLRSSLWFGGTSLFILLGLYLTGRVAVDSDNWVRSISIVQLAAAASLLAVVLRNLYKSRHQSVIEYYADKELPTLTVAIPARNETEDLEQCLRSIIANDYPKLEILVLDDCSQTKPSEVIKKFAHEGVRFIRGAEPNERWLAKNHAYAQLSDEVSGELILFCGVDVRFGPQAIRALVTTMLNRDKTMISVLPRRLSSSPSAAFIQPMRYWWELALPRRTFNRPPVLSTCWLIKQKTLKKLGGFDAVSRSIIPEGIFARQLTASDGYSFVRSSNILDIQTLKSIVSQRDTAVRMRYPQVRRRPEMVMMLLCLEFVFLLLPFILLGLSFLNNFAVPVTPTLISCGLLVLTHVIIVYISNPANVPLALINFPVMVLTEVVLAHQSMLRYEFSEIDWKGRNICIPVMHVVPKLPALSK